MTNLKKLTQLSQNAGMYAEQQFIKQQQELALKEVDELIYWAKNAESEEEKAEITAEAVRRKINTLITQIITNTGEELMRLAEGEKMYGAPSPRIHNKAIDTLKQHITSITGVE